MRETESFALSRPPSLPLSLSLSTFILVCSDRSQATEVIRSTSVIRVGITRANVLSVRLGSRWFPFISAPYGDDSFIVVLLSSSERNLLALHTLSGNECARI